METTLPPIQTGPSAWYGPDMAARSAEWCVQLTPAEVDELKAAARAWLDAHPDTDNRDISIASSKEFPLPLLEHKLRSMVHELMHCRGFVLVRGLPMRQMTVRMAAAIVSGIGAHMGSLRPQDARGSLVGHVRDQGLSSRDPNVRIYQTCERQGFHADWADVVGLLCVRPAVRGGTSMMVSSTTIFNEMRRKRPDLLRLLMEPMATDRRGEVAAGEKPYDLIPVFSYHEGHLTTLVHRAYIESALRFSDAPRLTHVQREALDMFDSLANSPDLNLAMRLEPGDIQFVYNHTMLHDRTAYEDSNLEHERRHLLRVWISLPGDRPLPPSYITRYGSLEVGNRGGVLVK